MIKQVVSKILVFTGIFAFTFLLWACEEFTTDLEDCENCYVDDPEVGDMVIYFTINGLNNSVIYEVYEGKVERNILIYSDTTNVDRVDLAMETNKYYSVKAFYLAENGDYITAIDGDELNTVKCEDECYIITEGIINVRLKYE